MMTMTPQTPQTAQVLENNCIAAGIWRMTVHAPGIGHIAAGQFAHVAVEEYLLRRPISVCDWDAASSTMTLIYQVVGGGTDAMTGWQTGKAVDMLAPQGNGFAPEGQGDVALVGGGVGVAPLYLAARQLIQAGRTVHSFLGFRDAAHTYLLDELAALGPVAYATEDGSGGTQGYVTSILQQALRDWHPAAIWTCGPRPMLKALTSLPEVQSIPTQASLEERMGCGMGGCLVCNCGIREGGDVRYRRVCKDGPVFALSDVVWEGGI